MEPLKEGDDMAKTKKIGYRIRDDLYEKLQKEENASKLIENLLDIYFEDKKIAIEKVMEDLNLYETEKKIKKQFKES
jgi:hypothetical protein